MTRSAGRHKRGDRLTAIYGKYAMFAATMIARYTRLIPRYRLWSEPFSSSISLLPALWTRLPGWALTRSDWCLCILIRSLLDTAAGRAARLSPAALRTCSRPSLETALLCSRVSYKPPGDAVNCVWPANSVPGSLRGVLDHTEDSQ
jgi:hypothetical protein